MDAGKFKIKGATSDVGFLAISSHGGRWKGKREQTHTQKPILCSINPFMRIEPSWPKQFPKGPFLETAALGTKFPMHEFWKGHIQTIAACFILPPC